MPHAERTTWAGISSDITEGVETLRREGIERVFTIGFCMGGRMSFLASTLGLRLAGVIGMYGTLQGPWRNDAPAPLDRIDDVAAPVLGLFGGADQGITAEAIAAFDRGLDRTGDRSSDRHLSRRTAQLLRPEGRRFRSRERGGLERGHDVHRGASQPTW
jgi:carboxymethylenebutenolidase